MRTEPGEFLLLPVGSAGDVLPFIGLGQRLRSRGHHVAIGTAEPFGPLAQGAGLEFHNLAPQEDVDRIVRDPNLWHPLRGFAAVARHGILPLMRRQFALAQQLSAQRPGLRLISSVLGLGARAARDALGLPLATVHLQPAVLWSRVRTPRLGPGLYGDWVPGWLKALQFWIGQRVAIDPPLKATVNAWWAELGLPPVRTITDLFHSPDRVIGLFPNWYAPPQPDWPPQTRLAAFPLWDGAQQLPLGAELEGFLDGGSPPIAFTPGTAMAFGRPFFAAAAAALVALGRRGLFLTRFADQLPELPPGVLVVDYAPFSTVLPRCAAIVHHGGIGTTSQGLAAGIPQVLMPMSHDQPDNAYRVARLGVGGSLSPARFRGPRLTRELSRLLGDAAVAARCAELAGRVATEDGLSAACDILEAPAA